MQQATIPRPLYIRPIVDWIPLVMNENGVEARFSDAKHKKGVMKYNNMKMNRCVPNCNRF